MIEFIPQLPETRLSNTVRIRRERRLPIPGEVSGAIGMRIGAQDILARAYPPKQRRALSLTRVIGVREADVPKRLLKQVGDPVEAREIIIAKPISMGVQRLVYRAPEAGQITAIQGSWMIMDVYGSPYDVPALYRGTIVSVTPRQGGIVEAQGALVQGAWGSGKEAVGVIKCFGSSPDAILDANVLREDARGSILIAGGVTSAALERAHELQASGIVVGSLDPNLRARALTLNLPLLATEGFGTAPMSTPVFELLNALNGQEAALNARYQSRGRDASRPELFVPLVLSRMQQSDEESEAKRPAVAPNARIRGICEPNLGRVGTLPSELVLKWVATEAGTQLPAVEVEWENPPGEREAVPWTNLELIG
ncbi:MAG: hypothetical protein EYC68_14395 [Chloroflexota bacterium]|nr:MAG: hypothetical protein EYC68_14395 [Chloroflexota bacterium]